MKPERLDLTVNMVSFQEMTEAQADAYVAKAHALNCPFVYSLNRDKSAYNPEITSVSDDRLALLLAARDRGAACAVHQDDGRVAVSERLQAHHRLETGED